MKRIAIHSVPRSGSTWLGQIFNSSPLVSYKFQPLFSYAFKDRLGPESSLDEIKRFFTEVSVSSDGFLNQKESVTAGICPVFKKINPPDFCVYKEVRYHHIVRNLLDKDRSIKLVGIVRNPLAVLSSWKLAPKEFRSEWDFASEWRHASLKNQGRPEEFYGFEKWKIVAELFLELSQTRSEQFRLIQYDDLLRTTFDTVRSIFEFCEIPFEDPTNDFLIDSSLLNHSDAYSVFKSKPADNNWKNVLSREIINTVYGELENTALERFCHAG